jgi:hypothetical protein
MATSDKNIVITPNIGQTADPKIVFSGADATLGPQNITLQVYPTSNGTLSFEGSSGQLFSITNSLSGTIFSVNDVSGIPSIEVLDTGLVKLAQYSGNLLLGTGTDNGSKLQVAGTTALGTNLANYLTVAGATTGNVVSISTAGSDANIGLTITTKGTGNIILDTGTSTGDVEIKPGSSNFRLFDDDSSHYYRFVTGNTTANYDITLPAGSVTLTAGTSVVTTRTISTTSPITGGGDLSTNRTFALAAAYGDTSNPYGSKTAKTFLAAPNAAAGVPTFRAIVASDIPTLNQNTTGSAATLTTARTLTIGSTGKTFNGSANVAWTLAEIGAYAATNPSGYGPTTGTDATGDAGSIAFRGGNSSSTGFGGAVTVTGGTSASTTAGKNGGTVTIAGGNNTSASGGSGASLSLAGGTAVLGAGGLAQLSSGDSKGTNIAGTDLMLFAGRGTGTGVGGTMRFYTSPTTTSGAGLQTHTSRLEINNVGQVFALANIASSSTTTGTLRVTGGVGVSGTVYAAGFNGALTGNATTATTLQTTRAINGTNFNGSAAITTANWGTARTLTIGAIGKSVNGSANIAWSLAEIGALPLAGGTMTGTITTTQGNGLGINLNAAGSGFLFGTSGDGANSTVANVKLSSWFGIGFSPSISGQTVPQWENACWMDVRTGAFSARNNITAYASDIRLKKNFINIPNALDKVKQIGGYEFDWDAELCASLGFAPSNLHEHGVKAQEILEVLPDAVTIAPFDNDGDNNSKSGKRYLTVRYEKLVPLLIEAIKDQNKEVVILRNSSLQLTKDNIELSNRVEKLEALVLSLLNKNL